MRRISIRPGQPPWGFVGMMVLVVLVERGLSRKSLDFATPTAADWRHAAQAARTKTPRAEILCFGDSMVKFGVLPKVIEARLGRSAYSLAVYNGTPQTSFFLLERAFDAGARPSALVVDFQPELLMADHITLHPRQWPELLSTANVFDLARAAGDHRFFLATNVARWLPSVKDRLEIRAEILAGLEGTTKSIRQAIQTYQRNWRVNQGSQVLPPNPAYDGNVPPNYALFFNDWECKPLNALYVRKFLKLAESRHVPVYWVMPPNVPPVQARRREIGLTAKYDQFARKALAKHANLTILDAREIGFPHGLFIDAVHLDRQGATRLSNVVSEELARGLRGEKSLHWVALDPSRWGAGEVPLEDTDQSRVALQRAGALR